MHPIFRITSADIKALNDGQARELVARLCKAELQARGIGTDSVTWGGDQRAKDGGVDVRVETAPGTAISGYVPKDATVYQVKAEPFAKPKIPGEMAPKGMLRPAITDLVCKSGAYVIVSTRDDLSDLSLSERKQVMADCLDGHGLGGGVFLDFYDSRKVADWTENHPAIVTWVRNELGKPLEGWRAYGPWAYHEKNVDDEYLLDEKVKVCVPNTESGIEVISAINRLRGDLGKSGASVRIVGLSGVGKTRLVQALFDHRIATANASLDQDNVLYTDLSDNPSPQPTAMLEALILEGSESVVVIDNCGQEVHQKLTEIVKRPDSKIRLVTIEYDIRDNLPEGTACYHLEGSSNEVIARLLKRHFQNLSDLDADKIVEFSDGNARVAFALASTSETKGELAQLRDNELFRRLFIQKNTESNELQRCAEAASLLYSFDVENASNDSELAVLSAVAEVTISTFYRNVSELQKRGLVQERGKWRAVLPHAISNRLALNAVQSNHPSLLVQKFVTDASERVARSFSRRLGYLHESKHAQQIVENWLKPEGFLSDVSSLNTLKWEMLENVSPVNQRAALSALLRAAETPDFIAVTNSSRTHTARLLRSLAYEPNLFDDAASALLKFALVEPDDYKSDSTHDILQSLFYVHLSGTLAPPEQRAAFVRTLAISGDDAKQKLALILLRAGLESHHFSSHYGFDFGALKRSYGWHPRTLKDIQEWYRLFIQIAVDLGKTTTPLGSDARALLGSAFRGLWRDARMHEALTDVTRELAAVDGWPDGWIGIRNTLHWDKEYLDDTSMDQLKALEQELAPRELLSKIKAKVLSRGAFGIDLDDECEQDDSEPKSTIKWYYKAQEEAEMLGKAAAFDTDALSDLTPYVSGAKSTDKSWHFGFGIGQSASSTQEILGKIKKVVPEIKKDGVNSIFIRGLVAGWNKAKPSEVAAFLECALTDEVWGEIFPELQVAIGIDAASHGRLVQCIKIGKAPAWQFQYLGMGRATDPLSVEQIASLITPLAAKPDGGLHAAIDVLSMVIHCSSTKDEKYKKDLRAYCLKLIDELDWSLVDLEDGNFLHHLEGVIEFGLDNSELHDDAIEVLNRLIRKERSRKRKFHRRLGNILLPFFKKYPIQTLDAVYTKDKETDLVYMLKVRLDRHGNTAIEAVPEESLLAWCRVSPEDRCVFAAQTCKLFERPNPGENSDETVMGISNTATTLLALTPDKKKVLEILVNRFYPTSWSGSLAAIMRQRLQYLDYFNPTSNPELTTLIAKMRVDFLEAVENQERREREQERSETGSFE
ncbi:hypothetical protein LQR31_09975 [Chromobacterium vaccinii]|uniref:hypothetical protein n=1 Tax=Chromobacterium vaccinii TaxID=1108595 RepID=UPI001E3C6069|nr:hypothetical protein [Chromobacterium vaccinii]MCD4484799.1 hypothetical protein [Chromobacterium vaccinii]